MGRKASNVVNAEVNRLRRILEENPGKLDQDLMIELGIKKATFYRYKNRIRQQDIATWNEIAKETTQESSLKIMNALDFASRISKAIASDPLSEDRARLEATKQLIQNNVWRMQLLERGPKLLPRLEEKVIEEDATSETTMESIQQ